jgi:spore coat protein U-like protein
MLRSLLAAALMVACISPVLADSTTVATGQQPVQASVTAGCRILSIDGLLFGKDYNPITNPTGAEVLHNGTITLSCTQGVQGWIGMGPGANGPNGQADACNHPIRRLFSPQTGDYLVYDLEYTPDGSGGSWLTWGCDQSHSPAFTSLSVKTSILVQEQALMPGGQDVHAGDYNDAVMLTVNF